MSVIDTGRELAASGKYMPTQFRRGASPASDIPLPPDPREDVPPDPGEDVPTADERTSWEPIDLGPFLRGEVVLPQPTVGVYRCDGQQFLYPGREHSVLGGTEAGKTWLALMCCAAELQRCNSVVYVHFEESDPASTIERLRLLGVDDAAMTDRLRFAAPACGVRPGWLLPLLNSRPSLVILDGINEAIMLHGHKVDIDGWSVFRQSVIVPFKVAGAAVLGCDHLPIAADESRRDAYGTGHKGNVLDGARLMLVNKEPFGRQMRGRSQVFITKDRPGQLRSEGIPSKTPGVTFVGTLVVDDSQSTGPDFIAKLFAPKADEVPRVSASDDLKAVIIEVISGMPARRVSTKRGLLAALRNAGHQFRTQTVIDALDDLVDSGVLGEVPGPRHSTGLEVRTVSPIPAAEAPNAELPAPFPVTDSPTDRGIGKRSTVQECGTVSGNSGEAVGKQSEEIEK